MAGSGGGGKATPYNCIVIIVDERGAGVTRASHPHK
jgi:hypothetical protein